MTGILSGAGRKVAIVIVALALVAVAFVIASVGMASAGDPGACDPRGGALTVSPENAAAFLEKWAAFEADTVRPRTPADLNEPAHVVFTESELSSRANEYVEDEGLPFEDVRVCVDLHYGEVSGVMSFMGLDFNVKLTGTLDLSGDRPRAQVDSAEIGRVPGWLSAPARFIVDRSVDRALNDMALEHEYTLLLGEASANVYAEPAPR